VARFESASHGCQVRSYGVVNRNCVTP
jgi:hypothetical protein